MTENKVTVAMEKFASNVPQSCVEYLRGYLQGASDDCFDVLMQMPMKGKIKTVLFSIFLGGIGVDRFYLGNVGLGVFKLLSNILSYILLLVPILGIILVIARGIWGFVDIFLCYKKAKAINYQALSSYLISKRQAKHDS